MWVENSQDNEERLVTCCGRSLEDQIKVIQVINEGSLRALLQSSEESKDSVDNGASDHLCYILAKTEVVFVLRI